MGTLVQLDPATYVASRLHSSSRVFPETNCYTDIWIELLHAHGFEPAAVMAPCLNVDFEGDQWTFFKPLAQDLELLYGIDVHEMQTYRPITEHIQEQLLRGRSMIVEVDAFYLPDSSGSSYGKIHQKTAIAVAGLDSSSEELIYFHGRGLYKANGSDYRNLFHLSSTTPPDILPPYVELVRFDAGKPLAGAALYAAAHEVLCRQLRRTPDTNPWLTFGEWLAAELPNMVAGSVERYHSFAFATVRQAGAAFESAQAFVDWALPQEPAGRVASAALRQLVEGAKILLLKMARRRLFETAKLIESLATAHDEALNTLRGVINHYPRLVGTA